MKSHLKKLLICSCIIFTSINLVADDFWIKKISPFDVTINLIRMNQNDELFVGAHYTDTVPWGYGRIYRSLDYATTWEDITPFSNFPEIGDILINNDGVLFIGTWYGSVYRSYDNGDTFEQVENGLSNMVPMELAQQSDGTIYAGQFWGGGVDYTENDGDQWFPTNFPGVGINGLGINDSDAIFASSGSGLFYSDDNGLSWSERNIGLSSSAILNYKCFAFIQNAEVFTGTVDGIYFSENNGEEWVNCLNSQRVYHIQIFNDKIFAGTYEEGVYFSDDGGNSWSQKNEGLDWLSVYSFAVDSENHLWCNTPEGIYTSKEDLVSIRSLTQKRNDIFIYPNPCVNKINLLLPDKQFQNISLKIFNVDGKLVSDINKNKTEFTFIDTSFDISSLDSGLYLVCIKVDNKIEQTEKLIIR